MNPWAYKQSRRSMVRSLAAGSLLFPGIVQRLLAEDGSAAFAGPLAPRAPHFKGKAKSVIFMYMSGGVSHMDSFDPKPVLNAAEGKIDLIVMATHGRTGLARALFGSVAESVLHRASCPVLLVRVASA